MSAYSDAYEFDESEFFEEFDTGDEARLGFKPAKKISVPGAGLVSATLNTPKGPARLNLPAAVPTQTQFRHLEAALNAQTQRLNAVQAELVKVRRELVLRRREQQGMGSSSMTSMLMPLLLQRNLKEDLKGHTHEGSDAAAVLPTGSSSGLSSILPLLLFMPGIFGGSTPGGSSTSSTSSMDTMSPLLMAMVFAEL